MKKTKKFLSLVLAVLMLASVVPMGVSGANAYVINGVTVSVDDFSSTPDGCWDYANNIYKKIWGVNFSSLFEDESNCLRNLSDDQLLLNEENLRKFVSFAPLGACLRISSYINLHSHDGWVDDKTYPGHNQIIVQKDANGFTCLEGGLKDYPHKREKYYTWSEYCNTDWLGGRYEYIKYLKWPGAEEYKAEIKNGDIIEFGSYLGEPVTWRCVGVDENGHLMLSEKVLCFKSYDAKGNYSNSYRRSNGSNNWAETTLRHWLNSYGEVDWSNRISVPSNENVYYKKGGYDKELGFLSSFSEEELKCIKTVTLKTYLNSLDSSLAAGGTSEYNLPYADYADFFIEDMASKGNGKWYINTIDRMFILDPEQTAMCYFNLGEEFTFNPGATAAAFENEKTGLKEGAYYNIWMRVPATQGGSYQNNGATIHTDTIHKVNSGVIANAEDVGVRPAFYLDVDKYNSLPDTPSTPTPCKHTNSVNKPQINPNCIDIGFTAGVYCNDCETWLSGHEVIAVGDHKDANKDGRCDTCMKQLSSASTPNKPETPKKNIIQIIVDGVKTVVNNVVNFFKKLFGR